MVERTTRTEIINLGNELITGKKSDKYGRLIEPTAEVIPISNNIKLALDGDVGAVRFNVSAKYQEATQEEDVAYFLLEVFDADTNNLIGKYKKSTKDVPVQYNEYVFPLHVDFDVEKFRDKTIKLRAHLKCWLEESGWTPRGGGEESVSDEDFVNITLEVPEIKKPKQNPIISLNVIGRGLAKDEKPKDYEQQDIGKEYAIMILVHNTTGNKLAYGELSLFENDIPIKPDPPFKEMAGGVQPITIKRSWDWIWYVAEPEQGGRLTITDKKDREFIYKLIYYLRDEYGFDFNGVVDKPSKKLKIVISITQAKLDAIEVYNWSFDEEENAKWAELALALALAGTGALVAWPALIIKSVIGGAAAGVGISVGGVIATWFAGKTIGELAQELRAKLKTLIDDPPKFDKNYKKLIKIQTKRINLLKPKNNVERKLHNILNSEAAISSEIDALLSTANRAWSAHHVRDNITLKKQIATLQRFKIKLNKDIMQLADSFDSLSHYWKNLDIKISKPGFIAFKKYVVKKGLPREVKLVLKKFGNSDKEIVKIRNTFLNLNTNKIDVAKYYSEYSKRLRKLAKSVLDFTY